MPSKTRHRGPVITMLWNTALDVRTRVAIGVGARKKISGMLAQIGCGKRVLVLCQPSTAVIWLREVLSAIPSDEYQVTTLEVPDGEACKSTDWLLRIWEHLQARGFDRKDTIIALGGGALTDVAGFAASTYLRGLNLILVPTSLLAQVDAAIGGKTAINLSAGKNLAGSFYFPKAVVADQELLKTLPEPQFVSGIGEILKYALIEDTVAKNTDYEKGPRPLLEVMDKTVGTHLEFDDPLMAGIISSCIKMKLFVVAKDPLDTGLRRCLNLGHTVGHALEVTSNYELTHGEGVAVGLYLASKLSAQHDLIPTAAVKKVKDILGRAGLPHDVPKSIAKDRVTAQIAVDKKRGGDSIKIVLPKGALGSVDYNFGMKLVDVGQLVQP